MWGVFLQCVKFYKFFYSLEHDGEYIESRHLECWKARVWWWLLALGISFSLIQTEVSETNFSFSSKITLKKQMINTSRGYTVTNFAVALFQRNKRDLMAMCAFHSHVLISATQYRFFFSSDDLSIAGGTIYTGSLRTPII